MILTILISLFILFSLIAIYNYVYTVTLGLYVKSRNEIDKDNE